MNDDEFRAARRRVVRRYFLRVSFVFNLLFFLLVLVLIAQDDTTASEKLAGGIAFSLIYGAFLLLHGNAAFNPFGKWIDRAARREMEQQNFIEKPKRHHLELGEDGELNEVVDDLPLDNKAKHSEKI